jgi:hypothetical protein
LIAVSTGPERFMTCSLLPHCSETVVAAERVIVASPATVPESRVGTRAQKVATLVEPEKMAHSTVDWPPSDSAVWVAETR